jgi:hypothetical protein
MNHLKNIAVKYGVDYERLLRQSRLVRASHVVLAVLVAFVYQSQRDFSHYAFWRSSGGGVLAILAVPVWPYAMSCVILWRRTTLHWARAWIFCFGMLLISVALCFWYLSPLSRLYGLQGNLIVTWFQFVTFGYFGKWAFEDAFDDYKQERW